MAETEGAAAPAGWLEARPHPIATIVALLLVFVLSGIFVQILPVSAPVILKDWALPDTALAAPITAVLVGSGIGTVAGGAIADTLGRRISIGASVLLLGLFLALASLAQTPWQLALPMFLAGLAMGGLYTASMALVTELVPEAKRPIVISFTVASLPVGFGLCSTVASAVLPAIGWRAFFQIAALASVPVFLGFFRFVPESPGLLARLPRRRGEYLRVIARLGLPAAQAAPGADDAPQQPLLRRFAALIRANPGATIGIFGLFFATYIFGNAILSWLPVALGKLGLSISFASGAMTAWTLASIAGTPLAGWCLFRLGVRPVSAFSAALGAASALGLALAAAGVVSGEGVLLAFLAMGGVASAGVVTALLTLAAEAYPPEVRAMGMGMSDAIGRIGGVGAAFSGIYIIAGSGPAVFFGILAVLMVAVAAYLLWLHPHAPTSPAE
ncbi:MFS transporter [Sphingomonas canadensis]|uniref:MFS transporter n=1 Tax=Sphingomonas canadensis TaxID=1219257 RepID=A0ABW3HDM1_9SPHN|nr:MFS transporter [Sphingomonas canadensis]MCW3836921.1 MFS transporter [Sphingomonas canadensis]